jgi:hypothetical protein
VIATQSIAKRRVLIKDMSKTTVIDHANMNADRCMVGQLQSRESQSSGYSIESWKKLAISFLIMHCGLSKYIEYHSFRYTNLKTSDRNLN